MNESFIIEFIFKYENIKNSFVRDIYSYFFNNGFNCSENSQDSLEEIIQYNQMNVFKINSPDNYDLDFEDIFIINSSKDNIRLSWSNEDRYIFLTMEIPESSIFKLEDNKALFYKSKLYDFVSFCISFWTDNDTDLIYSQFTLDSFDTEILVTDSPSFNPFGIIKDESYEELENKKIYQIIQELPDAKVLIVKNIKYTDDKI